MILKIHDTVDPYMLTEIRIPVLDLDMGAGFLGLSDGPGKIHIFIIPKFVVLSLGNLCHVI